MSIKIDINIKEFKKKQVKEIRDCINEVLNKKVENNVQKK